MSSDCIWGKRSILLLQKSQCSVLWGFGVLPFSGGLGSCLLLPIHFLQHSSSLFFNASGIAMAREGYRCWQGRREQRKLQQFNFQWSQNLLKKLVISPMTAAVGSHELSPFPALMEVRESLSCLSDGYKKDTS